jgi:hypothetical protein
MARTCAWCKKELAAAVGAVGSRVVSKGICGDCLHQIEVDSPKSSREIVDLFGVPVLLVDNGSRILAANKHAQKILNKPFPSLENHLPGEAVECVNSRQPGGCGKTVHCHACALRKTLEKTIASGEGMEKVPAYLDVFQKDGSVIRRLLYISTEKLADFVLLRIDGVETLRTMQVSRPSQQDIPVS